MGLLPNQAPLASFDDPLGLLVDCHRRIERFLGVLGGVAARDARLDAEARAALAKALDYFRDAAPRHTSDEEHSLFPRLARVEGGGAELARLTEEHAELEPAHARIDALGRDWLARGELGAEEHAEFAALVAALALRYAEHIAHEERVVFPLARARLDRLDLLAIGVEMRARRDL